MLFAGSYHKTGKVLILEMTRRLRFGSCRARTDRCPARRRIACRRTGWCDAAHERRNEALFRIAAERQGRQSGALDGSRSEEGKEIMNRYGLVGVGAAAGFAAALILFPAAHGATTPPIDSSISSSDAFETRPQGLRPSRRRQRARQLRHPGHGLFARSAFELHGREGLRRHADPDARRIRRPRPRSDDGRRPRQSGHADRRHAGRQSRHEDGRFHRRDRLARRSRAWRSTTRSTRCAARRARR